MAVADIDIDKTGLCYLLNPKLKKAFVKIPFTRDQIDEHIRCQKDVVYFIENYVKIVSLDHGLVSFDMYSFQKQMVQTFDEQKFTICLLSRQMGKALDVDTPIPTPNGFKTMGELEVGDYVVGSNGHPCKVTLATPYQHNRRCYEVMFDDGSVIVADADHIWTVFDKKKRIKADMTTQQILDAGIYLPNVSKERRFFIGNCSPVELPERRLLIDPYLLGYWLGDGTTMAAEITHHVDDSYIVDYVKSLGYSFKSKFEKFEGNTTVMNLYIHGFVGQLKAINVLGNKHVPELYMFASKDQRLALLRGLMDSDGCSAKSVNGKKLALCEFCNKNFVLAEQVAQLCASMGMKPRMHSEFINGTEYHYVQFSAYSEEGVGIPFLLERKTERLAEKSGTSKVWRRFFVAITPVESRPVKCIQVDSADHLYLAGNRFIPTHNTTSVGAYILHYAIFNKNKRIAVLANKGDTAREILSRIKSMFEDLPWFLKPGVVEWNKGSIEFSNGTKIISASTSNSGIRGQSMNLIYLDELAFVQNDVEFFTSTYPVISAGKTTKVIITSTPNGMNLFYKMWMDAVNKKSAFVPLKYLWDSHPDRDEAWKIETLRNISKKQFDQEFMCVTGDTKVTVRDTETGIIKEISIESLYHLMM